MSKLKYTLMSNLIFTHWLTTWLKSRYPKRAPRKLSQSRRNLVRGREDLGRRATPFTCTRSWSRSTLTPESLQKRWASWTHLLKTSSNASRQRLPAWLTTTSDPPSPPGRSRRLSASFSPGNWLSTPCLRAPRQWLSTQVPSDLIQVQQYNGPFQDHPLLLRVTFPNWEFNPVTDVTHCVLWSETIKLIKYAINWVMKIKTRIGSFWV